MALESVAPSNQVSSLRPSRRAYPAGESRAYGGDARNLISLRSGFGHPHRATIGRFSERRRLGESASGSTSRKNGAPPSSCWRTPPGSRSPRRRSPGSAPFFRLRVSARSQSTDRQAYAALRTDRRRLSRRSIRRRTASLLPFYNPDFIRSNKRSTNWRPSCAPATTTV
jgi:hypothetical protein